MSVQTRDEVQTSEILQDTMPSSTPLDTAGETLTHTVAPYTLAKVYRWLVGISKAVLGEATRRNGSKRVQGLEQTLTGKITSASTAVTGSSTLFQTELFVGAFIAGVAGEYREVAAIASNTSLTLVAAFSSDIGSAQLYTRLQMLSERIDAVETFENYVLNSDFKKWALGTSLTTPTSDTALADNYYAHYDGSIGTFVVSQNSFTLGQTDVPGEPQYYLRWNQTAGGSAQTVKQIRHRIAGVRAFAGQTMQVTFYAKMGSGADISVGATQYFGSGGSPSSDVVVTAKTRTLLTAFSRHTVTLTIPSISGKSLGTNLDDALYININLPLNTTHDFYLANVSAYAGTAEVPYKKNPIDLFTTLQSIFTSSGAADSTTSVIPVDNTKPQNTEGKAYSALDTTIVPTSLTNIIRVEFEMNLSFNAGGAAVHKAIVALFKDSGADALTARLAGAYENGNSEWIISGSYEEVAGSMASRTYKLRYGTNADQVYVNSAAGSGIFNGVNTSWMRVSEIKA